MTIKKIEIKDFIFIMKQAAENKERYHAYGIVEDSDRILCGEYTNGIMIDYYELNVKNKSTLCQELYDAIIAEFGDNIISDYEKDIGDNTEYFIYIGENVVFTFPTGNLYSEWINKQIKKESKKR